MSSRGIWRKLDIGGVYTELIHFSGVNTIVDYAPAIFPATSKVLVLISKICLAPKNAVETLLKVIKVGKK
ncbi:hypothetical protein ACPOL_4061 [Acidisarcina polymorpha]|uniref:Uncharacterized protein n=1 Tax=Acidisarcina polymorpha TaxID=2211140 RepID=A0A2Z5G2T9_9BACT|nr:hypothetical protein [Acidisarcina polymorpha]AXC13340.1 hypothetical protein ACPOL_4061 [Acidisarcina polymorpha]